MGPRDPGTGKQLIKYGYQAHIQQKLYRWVSIEHEHYQMAKNWILQFNTPLRTLDALHLAVASSKNLTLLTADQQLSKAADLLGVDVLVVEG